MNEDGSLLAGSGKDINIISAIFANIWASYEKCGNLEYYMEELEVFSFKIDLYIYKCIY